MAGIHLGFTRRAHCLFSGGITATVCGIAIDERELMRGGLFAIVLPLISALAVARQRVTISASRSVSPARIADGEIATVTLSVSNTSALPTSTLMLEDTLPEGVGGRARVVLDGLRPHSSRNISYRLPVMRRGVHEIGPLSVRLTDPFGLIDRSRYFRNTSKILVTPTVYALPGFSRYVNAIYGSSQGSSRGSGSNADDLSIRQYRNGDDRRRIHWRLSARAGQLMVRQHEQPGVPEALLILDTRLQAHPLSQAGLDGAAWQRGSFEWMLSASASIGAHLADLQRPVAICDAPGHALPAHHGNTEDLLAYLAQCQPRVDLQTADIVRALADVGAGHIVVMVLADTSPQTARQLAAHTPSAGQMMALLIDTASFVTPQTKPAVTSQARDPHTKNVGVNTPSNHDSAAEVLRNAGWSVAEVTGADAMAEVWTQVVAQRELLGKLR